MVKVAFQAMIGLFVPAGVTLNNMTGVEVRHPLHANSFGVGHESGTISGVAASCGTALRVRAFGVPRNTAS